MTNLEHCYQFDAKMNPPEGARYFFVSEGEKLLIKVVEYDYIGVIGKRPTYNLGFGTFNFESRQIDDEESSMNGDHYKVFNTVLQTIPDFLGCFPDAMIMVAAIDSQNAFGDICRHQCLKKCLPTECKNMHRRIRVYKGFLNKNYSTLIKHYNFLGGINADHHHQALEEYRIENEYDVIFF